MKWVSYAVCAAIVMLVGSSVWAWHDRDVLKAHLALYQLERLHVAQVSSLQSAITKLKARSVNPIIIAPPAPLPAVAPAQCLNADLVRKLKAVGARRSRP